MKSGIRILSLLLVTLWMAGCAITVHNQEATDPDGVATTESDADADADADETSATPNKAPAVGIRKPAVMGGQDEAQGDVTDGTAVVAPKEGITGKKVMKKSGEATEETDPEPEPDADDTEGTVRK